MPRKKKVHRFAEDTKVSPEKSRMELEKVIKRYIGEESQYMFGWDGPTAVIGFRSHDRTIRFELQLPSKNDVRFKGSVAKYEQAIRQKWRALVLVVKSKLESVESGITTFEKEFLAQIVLPNGMMLGTFLEPYLKEAYGSGEMPLLPPSARVEREV